MYFQADIKDAFKAIPIAPDQREFAWAVFKHKRQTLAAQHLVMPFGSAASVHHWERVGSLLAAIARRILHIPVSRRAFDKFERTSFFGKHGTFIPRFVDDFYAPERAGSAKHAMEVFARCDAHRFPITRARYVVPTYSCFRMVRCLLGPNAIAANKLEAGMPLVILGIQIEISSAGVKYTPEPKKVKAWTVEIKEALFTKKLHAGEHNDLRFILLPFVFHLHIRQAMRRSWLAV